MLDKLAGLLSARFSAAKPTSQTRRTWLDIAMGEPPAEGEKLPTLEDLRRLADKAVVGTISRFGEERPGKEMFGFALCVDEDMLSVFGRASTQEYAQTLERQKRVYYTGDWDFENHDLYHEASLALAALSAEYYQSERPDIGPGDNHLRPWKADLFRVLVDVLGELRAKGAFSEEIFLLVGLNDCGEWMLERMNDGARALNRDDHYKIWRTLWYDS